MAHPSKAKGRRLQNYMRDLLRKMFPILEEDDIKSQIMGMGGEDIVLSPAAKKIPYSFECKNVEKLNIWSAIEQASKNCEDRQPVVVIKRNRTKTYAVVEVNHFIDLISSNSNNNVGS